MQRSVGREKSSNKMEEKQVHLKRSNRMIKGDFDDENKNLFQSDRIDLRRETKRKEAKRKEFERSTLDETRKAKGRVKMSLSKTN